MIRNSLSTNHRLLRHPDNSNLHLHYADTYEGQPVMVKVRPFIEEYLYRCKQTIDLSLDQYSRVMAFRVDLRLPLGIELPEYAYTNEVISRFIESFKAKIEHHRNKARGRYQYAHGCKVRYVWVREVAWAGRPHYHLLILLNREAFYTVGKLESVRQTMIDRLKEAWATALQLRDDQLDGLVEIPDNATYLISRQDRKDWEEDNAVKNKLTSLFYRASYLCKSATKSYGDRQRGFDTSRG